MVLSAPEAAQEGQAGSASLHSSGVMTLLRSTCSPIHSGWNDSVWILRAQPGLSPDQRATLSRSCTLCCRLKQCSPRRRTLQTCSR